MSKKQTINTVQYDKFVANIPNPTEAWNDILKKSGFTKSDEAYSRNCRNRKIWYAILKMLAFFLGMAVVALGFFAIEDAVMDGPSILLFGWIALLIIAILCTISLLMFGFKTKKMLIKNDVNMSKLKNVMNDTIFHEAMLSQIKEVEKSNFCKKLDNKFSPILIAEDELNHDAFIPVYFNKRNAIIHSFHKTTWIQKPYTAMQTRTIGKNTSVKTVVVLWPAPIDNQHTCITDTTSLALDLTYVTTNKQLKSERAIKKFNSKNLSMPLENNEFNKIFPAHRSDEHGFRVLFDLVTQENIVNRFKNNDDFGSYKDGKYVNIHKHNTGVERTFAPTYQLDAKVFFKDYKNKFFYFFSKACVDYDILISAHSSFTCFSLENEKKYEYDGWITDLEIENIVYSIVRFSHSFPKGATRTNIHHFHFERGQTSKNGVLEINVHDEHLYWVPKTVVKEGVGVIVEDYHYDKQKYKIFLYKTKSVRPTDEPLPPQMYIWNDIGIYLDITKEMTAAKAESVFNMFIK